MTIERDIKYCLYARKSSEPDDKQVLSIPAQIREGKELAARLGIKISDKDIFQEAKSARIPEKRAEFDHMLALINERKYNGIICWHINRLSRNPQEGGIVQQMLVDKRITEIVTPQETIQSETMNEIIVAFLFGFSSQTSREISQNTKRGMKEKVERGQWPTLAPLFYENYGVDKWTKTIRPDASRAPYYERWVDDIIAYRLNIAQAHALLAKMGVRTRKGKKVSKSMVHRILRSPVYRGIIQYGNYPEKPGTFEALISHTKWHQLQEILDDRTKPNQTKRNHPYMKVCRCGKCGLHVTASTKVKPSGKPYTYYHCSKRNGDCGNPPVRAKDFEDQLISILRRISISQEAVERLKELTKQRLEHELRFEIDQRSTWETQLNSFTDKLDRLLELRIENEITKEQYEDKRSAIQKEIDYLEEKRKDIRFNREDVRKVLELFFEQCHNIENIFHDGTIEERRRIIGLICENLTLTDKVLGCDFRSPFNTMVKVASGENNDLMGGWRDLNPRPPLPQRGALTN